eukprot:6907659-Prymnesium_polylepis.1
MSRLPCHRRSRFERHFPGVGGNSLPPDAVSRAGEAHSGRRGEAASQPTRCPAVERDFLSSGAPLQAICRYRVDKPVGPLRVPVGRACHEAVRVVQTQQAADSNHTARAAKTHGFRATACEVFA